MSKLRIWKDHSRIKLRFHKHYLQVCADHHKKDNYKKFTYVDLFSGAPKAHFKNKDVVDGSPLIALKKGVRCILNDYDEEIYKSLEVLKKSYSDQIIAITKHDVNVELSKILEKVSPYYHSLFYIDPDKSSDLKWSTVQSVIDYEYTYKDGTGKVRRPEILLNFPYYSIARICGFIDKDEKACKHNTDFYGNDEWIKAYKSGKTPIERRENLLNKYIEKFRPYYNHLYSYLVESVNGTPLYYIIFLSNYEKIDKILIELVENINKWKKEDFIREYKYKINCPIDLFCKSESVKIVNDVLDKLKKNKSGKREIAERKTGKPKLKTSQKNNLTKFF